MTDWHSEHGLTWRELSPFGVELDVDLSAPLSAAASARFVSLFWQHSLLIAHRQHLSMDRQRELLSLLGPILLREGESGYLSNEGENRVVRSELAFHCDAAYTENPLDVIALFAVDVTDGASSTRFVSAERAHDNLPAALLAKLSAHEVEMISPGFDILGRRCCEIRDPAYMVRGIRPTVLLNPHTRRHYLNVSEMHASRLIGMDWEDSRALLLQVYEHLYPPENHVEHVWHRGDLVIWDNMALQHARGSLEGVGRRILQRAIVASEGVAPHAAI